MSLLGLVRRGSAAIAALILTAGLAIAADSAIELDWDELIPSDWRPEAALDRLLSDAVALSDDDPRAMELMAEMEAMWADAPVVESLDGRRVKLPGYVVPLDMERTRINEFLLVPYFGACIHVPPPPANQTVYVRTEPNKAYRGNLYDVVWVTGVLSVKPKTSELGHAGYTLSLIHI